MKFTDLVAFLVEDALRGLVAFGGNASAACEAEKPYPTLYGEIARDGVARFRPYYQKGRAFVDLGSGEGSSLLYFAELFPDAARARACFAATVCADARSSSLR